MCKFILCSVPRKARFGHKVGSFPAPTTIFFTKLENDYRDAYQDIFPEVRTFEAFKYLHVGIMSEIQHKFLQEIAKVVGLDNEQPLHHF